MKQTDRKGSPELRNVKNGQVNGRTLFGATNPSSNYLVVMVKDGSGGNLMKNMMLGA